MQNAVNLDGRDGGAGDGRQQDAAQGVAQRHAVAALQRLDDELAVGAESVPGFRSVGLPFQSSVHRILTPINHAPDGAGQRQAKTRRRIRRVLMPSKVRVRRRPRSVIASSTRRSTALPHPYQSCRGSARRRSSGQRIGVERQPFGNALARAAQRFQHRRQLAAVVMHGDHIAGAHNDRTGCSPACR